jgi:proteasome lid subunit RPN8/RPN11
MQLTATQQSAIRGYSQNGTVEEACGFIFQNGEVARCFNAHPEPADAFRIDPSTFVLAAERGIRAIWHSHAIHDGLSPTDQEAVRADGELAWVVYCLRTDEFHVADPTDRGPLVGRTFSYGILDCYSLVCDALRERHAIELPPWPRRTWGEWGEPGFTVFDEQVQRFCRQVGAERLLPGDIVFMGRDTTNHIGILTGPDRLLLSLIHI